MKKTIENLSLVLKDRYPADKYGYTARWSTEAGIVEGMLTASYDWLTNDQKETLISVLNNLIETYKKEIENAKNI